MANLTPSAPEPIAATLIALLRHTPRFELAQSRYPLRKSTSALSTMARTRVRVTGTNEEREEQDQTADERALSPSRRQFSVTMFRQT